MDKLLKMEVIKQQIEIESELASHIIPFWNALKDERGGFYGYMGSDLKLDKDGIKGVILNSRILWFYSNLVFDYGKSYLLPYARHAYEFLRDCCYDGKNGGVYWAMNADGSVNDSMKHTYCQAFAIYALSSYYAASRDKEALQLALKLFETVEERCTDDVAYLEAFTKEWEIIPNDALSENGLMADKTMNTTLHVMEAYTELYRVSRDKRVLERLNFCLDLTYDKIYDKEHAQLRVFFDKQMNEIGDIYSYGHDIEATWLIDRACDVIGDKETSAKFAGMNKAIVRSIADRAFENGALNNEVDKGVINKWRIWWVEAEGVIGFMNAYQRNYGEERNDEYLKLSMALWAYIRDNLVDKREGGEWYSQVTPEGQFAEFKPEVDPWKCPYHNGRMCMELLRRIKSLTE